MVKTPETSMKIWWILMLTFYARTTLCVLNNGKTTTTTTSSDNKVDKDELQAVASNLVGYQYIAPSASNNDFTAVNTALQNLAPHRNHNYSLSHTSATFPSSYRYPHPTAAPLTEPTSHYYLPPATSTTTSTPSPSPQQFGHQLGYNYAAPAPAPATYHASFSMGGWPLYQHSGTAPAVAVSLQGDIKEQQQFLNDASSYFVPQNGKSQKIGGSTNSYRTQSFLLPRPGKNQPTAAVEVEANETTFPIPIQTHNQGYKYERPISIEIGTQDSLRQPLESSTSHNFLSQNPQWPQLHRFVPQENLAAATKTENLATAMKLDNTQASNHNYDATSRPTARPSYGSPHDFKTEAASAHKPKSQFNGAQTFDSQTRVLQQLHTSVPLQQTHRQQELTSAPSQAPLDSFESYLNYRIQQQQLLQAQTPKADYSNFGLTAYPNTKPSSLVSQVQQINSQGFQSPATFPASTLEVPYAAPVGDFAAQTSALPAATSGPHAVSLESPTSQIKQNVGFASNQHFNLDRPVHFDTRNVFSERPSANTLLSGERYTPNSARTGSDFLQMQSQSYELPTHSYYAMEAAVPSRELSIAALNGQQQQQTDNAALHQPHAVYGAPALPSSVARPQFTSYSPRVGQFQF